VLDLTVAEAERIDIRDTTRTIDDPVRFGCLFDATVSKDNVEPFADFLNSLDPNTCPDLQADALALRLKSTYRISVHRRQELRQRLQDRDRAAGSRIDMAELERDHAAADEDHGVGTLALAQHVVRGDHVLGAGNGQRPGL
jgi:hypothetical protein